MRASVVRLARPLRHLLQNQQHATSASAYQYLHHNQHVRHNQTASAASEQFIVKSPAGVIDDIPDGTFVGQYLLDSFRKYNNKVAIVDGVTGETFTYAQLLDRITAVGSGLVKRGLKPGDVVTLFAPNSAEWAISFLAVTSIGAVCSAVNPFYTIDELQHVLSFSESEMIITTADLYPIVQQTLAKMAQTNMKVLLCNGEAEGCLPFHALYSDDRLQFPEHLDFLNNQEDLVSLPFSSGTTGLPKGVMLTHSNIITNMLQVSHPGMMNYSSDDVLTGVLPFYHIYGQTIVCLAGLKYGAKIVTLPKFESERYLQTLQDHRITVLHTAPPMMLFLAKHPSVPKYDLTSIQAGFTGAAPIGQHTLDEAAVRIKVPNAAFSQVYGLTEASPATNCNPRDAKLMCKDSIGLPVPSSDMKVVDIETGESLPPRSDGELCFRGAHIMKGYLKNEEATNDTVKDGWLHSGDIGYYDEQGFTFVTDRLKELIKVKGFQVAPAELESLLLKHPSVRDSAVIGIEDERSGELPRAYIVLKDGKKSSEKDIKEFIKDKVAKYKQLEGGVIFTEAIPKTASGKILRRQLKAEYKKNGN